jgi:hypothetical protein
MSSSERGWLETAKTLGLTIAEAILARRITKQAAE